MERRVMIEIINQLFEIEKKAKQEGFERGNQHFNKTRWLLEQEGFVYKDPTGEKYDHTRTDCEATILKEEEPLIISETLKPAIYIVEDDTPKLVQQARVII